MSDDIAIRNALIEKVVELTKSNQVQISEFDQFLSYVLDTFSEINPPSQDDVKTVILIKDIPDHDKLSFIKFHTLPFIAVWVVARQTNMLSIAIQTAPNWKKFIKKYAGSLPNL